jgi:hypothetical protein
LVEYAVLVSDRGQEGQRDWRKKKLERKGAR